MGPAPVFYSSDLFSYYLFPPSEGDSGGLSYYFRLLTFFFILHGQFKVTFSSRHFIVVLAMTFLRRVFLWWLGGAQPPQKQRA